jgi:hypothetical protein
LLILNNNGPTSVSKPGASWYLGWSVHSSIRVSSRFCRPTTCVVVFRAAINDRTRITSANDDELQLCFVPAILAEAEVLARRIPRLVLHD